VLRRALSVPPIRAWVAALFVSSAVFAFVHHLGPDGEGITLTALAFRTLAGLFLGVVYGARGFAVAVYTHALYDALVFFVLS
jgi:membrane protease YdiL (CAAX protease family)